MYWQCQMQRCPIPAVMMKNDLMSHVLQKTAELLGREHSVCKITPQQYFDIVPYVMYNMEQPLGDASAIVFTIACNATAEHTKICYSGEGADEFFGGYNMYRNAERYGENLKTFYVGNTNIMKEDEKKKILKHYQSGSSSDQSYA